MEARARRSSDREGYTRHLSTHGVTGWSHKDPMTDPEEAWAPVHESLPAGWSVSARTGATPPRRLRGVPQPNGSKLGDLERRIPLAYPEGAAEWSRENARRRLTEGELEGVVGRFES
jgi:hypothetical protein